MLEGKGLDDHVFLIVGLRSVVAEQRAEGDDGLARQFEVAGQTGGHDLADGAGVVVGHPFPEFQLGFGDERLQVDDAQDGLYLMPRVLAVQAADDASIVFVATKLHLDPQPRLQLRDQLFGDRKGVGLAQGQGEDDVGVNVTVLDGWGGLPQK